MKNERRGESIGKFFPRMHGYAGALLKGDIGSWFRENFPGDPEKYPFAIREVLPKGIDAHTELLLFEVMGHERAGKSSFIQYLKEKGLERAEVVIQEEFHYFGKDVSKLIRIMREPKYETWVNVNYDKIKSLSTQNAIENALKLLNKMDEGEIEKKPVAIVVERGPHDGLVYREYTNTVFKESEQEDPEEMRHEYIKNLMLTLSNADLVTAVLLFQNSIETAIMRRKKDNLPTEGYITNPSTRQKIDQAYGTWLGSYYPTFRQTVGTGLKVIDGEKPKEINNAHTLNYIQSVVDLAIAEAKKPADGF